MLTCRDCQCEFAPPKRGPRPERCKECKKLDDLLNWLTGPLDGFIKRLHEKGRDNRRAQRAAIQCKRRLMSYACRLNGFIDTSLYEEGF